LAETPDFRNVNWGDNVDKVKKAETAQFSDQANLDSGGIRIRYITTIESYKTNLVYIFDSNQKLIKASYVFDNVVDDSVNYIFMNKKLFGILSAKYGKPVNEDEKILSITDTWKTSNNIVTLQYHKAEDKNFLNLTYIIYEPIQKVGEGL
jgi:hypothetical protein